MLQLMKECMPWLNRITAGIAVLVIAGLILFAAGRRQIGETAYYPPLDLKFT